MPAEHPGAELVHDSNQETPEEQRHAREPQPEQQQRRAEEAQARAAAADRPDRRAHRRRVSGRPAPSQCSVASAQLASSVSTNPAARSSVLTRERASGSVRFLCTSQPAYAEHHRKQVRRAGRTGRRGIRDSHAPIGPIQLCTGPGLARVGEARIVRGRMRDSEQQQAARAPTMSTSVPSRSERATAADSFTLDLGFFSAATSLKLDP